MAQDSETNPRGNYATNSGVQVAVITFVTCDDCSEGTAAAQ